MRARPPSPLRRLLFRRMLALYPPYLGAGIRVVEVAPDMRALQVRMGLHFWNRNYVGTHFGGSLYSMVDPFYMLILMHLLGPGYVVWDKAATVRFRRPGRGPVWGCLEVPLEREEEIRRAADAGGKVEPVFICHVRDHAGEVVAEVEKVLHVRRKEPK